MIRRVLGERARKDYTRYIYCFCPDRHIANACPLAPRQIDHSHRKLKNLLMRKTLEMRTAILLRRRRPRRALAAQLRIHMSLLALAGLARRPSPPRPSILGIPLRGRRRRPGGGSRRLPCPECHRPGILVVQSCARRGGGLSTRMGWRTKTKTSTSISTRKRARRSRADEKPSFVTPFLRSKGLCISKRTPNMSTSTMARRSMKMANCTTPLLQIGRRPAQVDVFPRSQYQHRRYYHGQGECSPARSLHRRSSEAAAC